MAPGRRVEHLFATPLIIDPIEGAEQLNAELEALILARRQSHPGIKRSNLVGWHSDTAFLLWGGEAAKRLGSRVIASANAYTADLRAGSDGGHDWQVEGWANVGEGAASNAVHIHPGCYWSAVYYVRTDEGEGGELVLHDPRMPGIAMQAPDLRFKNSGGEQMVRVKPAAGTLLIFPSWLSHSVSRWRGSGLRISVAINLIAERRPYEGLVEGSAFSGYQLPQTPPETEES